MKIPEQYRKAYRAALTAGWTITVGPNSHTIWKPPTGRSYHIPCSSRSLRTTRNKLALLRKAGLDI